MTSMSDHAVILIDLDMDIKQLESQINENLKDIGDISDLSELVDKFNQALLLVSRQHWYPKLSL